MHAQCHILGENQRQQLNSLLSERVGLHGNLSLLDNLEKRLLGNTREKLLGNTTERSYRIT